MTLPVVLDADGLDALADPSPPSAFRALLREALDRGRDVLVPAVVCAEACRGPARTRRVETALARHRPARGQRPPVAVVDTDFVLARQVGAVLYGAGAGSADLADAHVVAVCARRGGGLVITSDPGDIARLAAAVPAARVVTRPAR
ncbi:MAG: type II toxin-antitoxin system VapC family toxin [Pseudonocardiaceae bacterium]